MPSIPPIVTQPSHWLMGGAAYYAQRAPLKWIPTWAKEYGDIYTITSRLGSAHIVTNPELARQVLVEKYRHYLEKGRAYAVLRVLMGNGLVTSSGEFWRGQRKLTQPAFHRRRLDAIFSMMVDRARAYSDRLAETRDGIDVAPLFSQLTLEIISRAMFSTDVESDAAHVGSYIATLNEGALKTLRHPWRLLLPRKISTPFTRHEFAARTSLNRMVNLIIARRRAEGAEGHDDLLAMFLSACDEETGRGMTDLQLRDEVMTMFVAGHETTANAMCWLLHLLSKNPEITQQIQSEIDAAGDALDRGDLSAFSLTRRAIEESLRIYPTIWSVGRRCVQDDQLGDYEIKTGSNLIIPIFHFHWSEKWWDDPEKFDPDRFLPENRPGPEIYFPFGAGPRTCIGNQFAMQELVIMTVVFLKRFEVLPVPEFQIEPDPLITLRPKYGMNLKFRERT
ncbi:cytochrome P450 [Luteolibacter pohnpeiensis]|uniref:Cytochrome P450 n=1 Tax=Luteolibacter pohnpeiensis TaxID=454153 RepID=A0A934VY36_9BACT|nr:cytochrome P450 [Luteolibacter pohnpeiensis]MBK1884483.1 cytochrome P450 [Luteolibacter pohnpeiensis]